VAHRGRKIADDLLATALAAGATTAEAAERSGLSARTVRRRMTDKAFMAGVDALRAEMTSRALGKLADGMAGAADVLRDLLGAERESVRLGAARSVLEMGARLREAVEVEGRLREVEQHLAEVLRELESQARARGAHPAAAPGRAG
jgi:hypothetical protein